MTKTFPLLPDYTCPELAGYKLPSFPRSQEDGSELMQLSLDIGKEFYIEGNYDFENGVRKGYTKAREKYEFSESDLDKSISWATNKARRGDISAKDIDDFIISLRTPRKPIAIEVEMWASIPGKDDKEIPKLNPDGTVKVVKWIFND